MGDTSATAQYIAQPRLPLMHSSNQMATTLGSGAGWPVMGASAPPTLPVFEAREPIANSAMPRNDNDTYFDNGDGTFHCETPLCSDRRPPDKTTRPNRSFILRHATSIQRTNEGAVHGMGARGDAHTHENELRSRLTPPECATTVHPGQHAEHGRAPPARAARRGAPPSRPHVPRPAQAWLQGRSWVGCTASSSRRRDNLRRLHVGGWRHWPHRSGDSVTAALATGAQRDVGVRAVQGRRHHATRPLHDEPGSARTAV